MLFLLCGTINQKGETESQLQTESQLNVKPESANFFQNGPLEM